MLLMKGLKVSEITAIITKALGLKAAILPMTDDFFETRVVTKEGSMHFEDYFVKKGARDEVLGVEFSGMDSAKPAEGVISAIMNAERVIVCPSNPIVSIVTILSVTGIREALRAPVSKNL